jgi:hypothetical protein
VLRCSVPDGWPALQAPGNDGPIPLPLVSPKPLRRARGYVDGALEGHLAYSADMRARVADLLSPGTPGEQHPAYRSAKWTWATGRMPAMAGPRAGALPRAVLLAVTADLDDGSMDRFGSVDFAWYEIEVDRSDARKQRARGRLVLHRLGAWPWTLAEAGRLPYGWSGPGAVERFDQPGDEFVAALRAWAHPLIARRHAELQRAASVLGLTN